MGRVARALVRCLVCGVTRVVVITPEETRYVIHWSGVETHRRYCPVCREETPHQLIGFDLGF